jgi:hypothetical protein
MPLARLTRWLRGTKPPTTDEWRGNEFGWALREISGEARHPRRPDRPAPAESTTARRARGDS